jgi:hypothetical protein
MKGFLITFEVKLSFTQHIINLPSLSALLNDFKAFVDIDCFLPCTDAVPPFPIKSKGILILKQIKR